MERWQHLSLFSSDMPMNVLFSYLQETHAAQSKPGVLPAGEPAQHGQHLDDHG